MLLPTCWALLIVSTVLGSGVVPISSLNVPAGIGLAKFSVAIGCCEVVATTAEGFLATSETLAAAAAPVKAIVNGPPLEPVTVTLASAGMVIKFAWTFAAVVPLVPVTTVNGLVALTPLNESVLMPLETRLSV